MGWLAQEREHPDPGVSRRERAAKVTEARVSITDPDVRVMKMPGGDFRPAYNMQFATDVDSQVIVGVGVINRGND